MRHQQNAVLTSLRRAQQFLEANSDVLDAVNKSTGKQLDDVVTQLSELSVVQDSGTRGSKGETARQRALRLALRRNGMAPIAELAKYKLRDVPEFAALMLPPANATAQATVAAAFAMAEAASAHAQTFVDNGLPSTFIDDLETQATAVSESVVDRSKQQGRRAGATAGLAAEERRGRSILRVLNALIMAHVGTNAQLVAEWKTARTVRRKPGPASSTQANDPTPVHPASAPATPVPMPTPTVTSAPTPAPATGPVAVAA